MRKTIGALLTAVFLFSAPIKVGAEFDIDYENTMQSYQEFINTHLEEANVDENGKSAIVDLINSTSDIRLNGQQWTTPMAVESLPILNIEFANLANEVSSLSVGESVSLEIPKFQSGYSTDLQSAFTNAYGDLGGKTIVDSIPGDMNMQTIMASVSGTRDSLVNEYKTTNAFESIKSGISVGDIFSAASAAVNNKTVPKQYTKAELQSELSVMTSGFEAVHKQNATAGFASIEALATENLGNLYTGYEMSAEAKREYEAVVEDNRDTVIENLPTVQELISMAENSVVEPDYGSDADFDRIEFRYFPSSGDSSDFVPEGDEALLDYWLQEGGGSKAQAVRDYLEAYEANYGRSYFADHPNEGIEMDGYVNIAYKAIYKYYGVTLDDESGTAGVGVFGKGSLNDGLHAVRHYDSDGNVVRNNFRNDCWVKISSSGTKEIIFDLNMPVTDLDKLVITYYLHYDAATDAPNVTYVDANQVTVSYGDFDGNYKTTKQLTAYVTSEEREEEEQHYIRKSSFKLEGVPEGGARYLKLSFNDPQYRLLIDEIEIWA